MKPLRTICITAVPFLLLGTYYFAGNIAAPDIQTRFEISGTLRNASFVDPNPYAMFGSDAVLLMTEHELDVDHKLQITDDKTGNLWEMDMQTGSVATYDKDGVLIAEKQLNSREMARWLTLDRFAEKYYSISPYSFAAGNPIRYIDINGDSLWIAHKGENFLYENGTLYLNGQEYTGKVKGFLKQSVNALRSINATAEGSQMISELSASASYFNIVQSNKNEFKADNIIKAYGQQHISENSATYQMMGMNHISGGSGGTIYWNPNGIDLPTTTGMRNDPSVVLGHEMFHGLDANRGALVSGEHNGIRKNEWQAVYRENMMRGQAGIPLRTHYETAVTSNGVRIGGSGPRMITSANQPILPSWYRP
ncbi:MAG: type III secretion system effector protein [Rikenellaceae bacterium]|nr:type III secretion system effector protein [Rikenellaceae bacterium]